MGNSVTGPHVLHVLPYAYALHLAANIVKSMNIVVTCPCVFPSTIQHLSLSKAYGMTMNGYD